MAPINCRNFGLFDNLFKKKNVEEKVVDLRNQSGKQEKKK